MKSLLRLSLCVLADAGIQCAVPTARDEVELVKRYKTEGLSFLTILLPDFCDTFERCLESGSTTSSTFKGFAQDRRTGIPRFLSDFLGKVFDTRTGVILDSPDETAILAVRQVTRAFKKLKMACTPERNAQALQGYKDVEDHVRSFTTSSHDVDDFIRLSRIIWSEVFGDLTTIDWDKLIPKHGPGFTADRRKPNQRYFLDKWNLRGLDSFPYDHFCLPNLGWLDDLERVRFLESGEEIPVKVVFVPKTQKAPRVIAMEPAHMQYMQQAVLPLLVERLEEHVLTEGHVNFTDQTVNMRLAEEASVHGHLATLDMKEASDRVSLRHVMDMLAAVPQLRDLVLHSRSRSALLEDGTKLDLWKFASMGSALCFPIESMLFYTLSVLGGLRFNRLPLDLDSIISVSRSVWVYGDDLVVPVRWVPSVIDTLESFGLMVNRNKSFWNGKFRESCGGDYFNGVSVKPIYFREIPCDDDNRLPANVLSTVATANLFYKNGWWRTAAELRRCVERQVGRLPYVGDTAPCIGWNSYLYKYEVQRWNRKLHRFEVKSLSFRPVDRVDDISNDPVAMLMKTFLGKERSDPSDREDEHVRNVLFDPIGSRNEFKASVRRGSLRPQRR